jgi:hypothetical protein
MGWRSPGGVRERSGRAIAVQPGSWEIAVLSLSFSQAHELTCSQCWGLVSCGLQLGRGLMTATDPIVPALAGAHFFNCRLIA